MSFEHTPKPSNGNKPKTSPRFIKHKEHTCIFKSVRFKIFGSLGCGKFLL